MISFGLALTMAGAAFAQGAGPSVPPATKASPAEQAIEQYRKREAPRAAPARCRRESGDTITVCGVTEGARAPFPTDQGIRDGARTATGELPSTAGIRYTNPVGTVPRTGVGVSLKGGKLAAAGLGQ
jgi:hypothetical protein